MLGHVVREPFAGDGVPVLRLSPPVLPADLVDRPRCHADVEESTCTVVTAPAGYGKSTLVASWAASAAWPVAWATLDAYDDGLRLLRLLVAALGRSVRVLAEPLAALGDALRGGRRDVAAGVDELLSVLDVLDAPAHLVLDDVHELPTSSLRGVLGPLVRYRPEALRLVLVSRYDAVLPLHRLRLSGRLHEVRSDRLAFTVAEVAQLAGHVRAGVDAATVRRLHAVTGGWPVAVRLALAAPGAGDLGERLTRAEAAAVPLTGYFVEEVLDQLQREAVPDEQILPLVRAVARIHVTEEARHMRYAREEFQRDWPERGALNKAYSRIVLGLVTYYSATRLINPKVYEQVGLDPKEAQRVARGNPHWVETKTWAARKVVNTLDTAGAITGLGRYFWKKAGLLGR